ncbi:MAG: Mur ligase family protein [bacterium]|nr:Mur ligase family protein [bacterium]
MIFLFSFFWFIRTTKALLFWIYLWQLKDYHLGRFIDHFRTAKGKQIFLNPLFLGKLVLFTMLFWYPQVALLLLGIYILEGALTFKALLQKRLLKPVWTAKTGLLVLLGLGIEIVFLGVVTSSFGIWYLQLLLGFDIIAPKIFSLLVLLLQPWTVLVRNRIIAKAKNRRKQFPNLLVIGITGSYGKTTTKEFLAHILSKKFKVLKTKEHQNSEVGVSNCILQELKPEHQVFVCEMGAYNKGGIKLLASIAKPSIGVLTGINQQHMATFGSQENIIQAKYELIESLPASGVAFFNAKNKYCVELYNKTNIRKALYGQAANFLGEENILGAMAVAKELGMTDEEISGAVKEIDTRFPGAKIQKGKDGFTIIEATYSANPDGVLAALEYLKTWPGKKVIVMPCLIELGSASREVHKAIGEKIGEVCDLAIITTRDRFHDIQQGAGGSEKVLFIENPIEIVERIKNATQAGDVVLLEGRIPQLLLSYLI